MEFFYQGIIQPVLSILAGKNGKQNNNTLFYCGRTMFLYKLWIKLPVISDRKNNQPRFSFSQFPFPPPFLRVSVAGCHSFTRPTRPGLPARRSWRPRWGTCLCGCWRGAGRGSWSQSGGRCARRQRGGVDGRIYWKVLVMGFERFIYIITYIIFNNVVDIYVYI